MSKVNKSKYQNIPLIYCAIKRGVRPIFYECAETHVETPMMLCLLRVKFCSWKLFVCLFDCVLRPLTIRSFRYGTPIYCPLRRT